MCDGCKKSTNTSVAVLDGKFGNYCSDCRNRLLRLSSAQSAQYRRDREREEHLADIVQPWDRNGNPNPEFARLYPEEAKLNFGEEEYKKLI